MNLGDAMLITALWGIWIMLIYWVFLSIGAVRYYFSTRDEAVRLGQGGSDPPFVTVLVPAHNEAMVIERTVHALCRQSYAKDRFEVIVVNDGSTDRTGEIVEGLRERYPQLSCHDVPVGEGGKGKSRTLNVGLKKARGELIAVFDADNTPEPSCLGLLVATLQSDTRLVAVNAKVRTRNRDASWLTRFINLEFIYFQWLFQGGRWSWFGLSMLMGTGYVIRREALDALGGFDEKSLVDDTEMSLRIFRGNRRIRWVPYAVTWEQEPETLGVWLRQRTRWTQGNLSVTWKYLPHAISQPYPLGLEMLTFIFNYVFFVPALVISHLTFWLSLLGVVTISLPGPFLYLWVMAVVVFTLHMSLAALSEERRLSDIFYSFFCYFTYAQLFVFVLGLAVYNNLIGLIFRRNIRWEKTRRTEEKENDGAGSQV